MRRKTFLVILITLISVFYLNAQNLSFSSDGKVLAANWIIGYGDGSTVNQFLFFDVATGKIKASVKVPAQTVQDPKMIFAPGDQSLIVGDKHNLITIKLTADNKPELQDFDPEFQTNKEDLIGIAPAAGRQILYKLYKDELVAYDLLTQKQLPEHHQQLAAPATGAKAEFIALHSNGQLMVEYQKKGRQHSLVIHHLAAKTKQEIKLPYDYEQDHEAAFSVQMSRDGRRLALRCESFPTSQISVWDLKNGASLGVFSVASLQDPTNDQDFYPIENFALSPDGKKLAVKVNDKYDEEKSNLLYLWDVDAKKETLTAARKYSEDFFAESLAFSPDSKQLAVSSQVLLLNSLAVKMQLLDVNTGASVKEF